MIHAASPNLADQFFVVRIQTVIAVDLISGKTEKLSGNESLNNAIFTILIPNHPSVSVNIAAVFPADILFIPALL